MEASDYDQSKGSLKEWQESAPSWEKHAPTIRAMFAPVTQALIEGAGIGAGSKVLDVAGGPGEPGLTIAETVGSTGFVVCTDAIQQMVDAAKKEARRRGLANVEFRQSEAESLPFEDASFDAVTCRLGAMFFSDPLAALKEMLRVTKPQGSVSLVVWGKSESNPFSSLISNVVSRFVPKPVEPASHDAFRFGQSGALAKILQEAGARTIRERTLKFRIAAPTSFAGFWRMRSETSSTLRDKLASLSSEEIAKIAHEVEVATKEFFPNNQMSFPAEMLLVTGKRG